MIVIVRSKSIDNNSKSKFSNSVNFKDLVFDFWVLFLGFTRPQGASFLPSSGFFQGKRLL